MGNQGLPAQAGLTPIICYNPSMPKPEILCYGLTERELYEQYQTEFSVGEAEENWWLNRYVEMSDEYTRTHGDPVVYTYGDTDAEIMRIHSSVNPSESPTLVNIHGGYWRAGTPKFVDFVAGGMVPRGINVINIGYGLMPGVSMSEIVRQIRRAVSTIYEHAEELQIDRDQLYVTGHSAGGHLAAVLASSEFENLPGGNPIKGVASISGFGNLQFAEHGHLSKEPNAIKLTREDADKYSPANRKPLIEGPIVLVVGALETSEFHRQAAELGKTWRALGATTTVIDMPDMHHYSLYGQFSKPDSNLSHIVHQQMGRA